MVHDNPGMIDDRAVKELIEIFNGLQDKEPQEFIAGLRENELKLVSLRDILMDVPRKERSPDQKTRLEKINTALSLVIALEYPVSELERKKLKDATELLKTL